MNQSRKYSSEWRAACEGGSFFASYRHPDFFRPPTRQVTGCAIRPSIAVAFCGHFYDGVLKQVQQEVLLRQYLRLHYIQLLGRFAAQEHIGNGYDGYCRCGVNDVGYMHNYILVIPAGKQCAQPYTRL